MSTKTNNSSLVSAEFTMVSTMSTFVANFVSTEPAVVPT